MPRRIWLTLFICMGAAATAPGADEAERSRPGWLLPLPEVDADPKIPALKEVVGHAWGEDISSHAEIARYLRALADAAPDRARLVPYGRTIERRELSQLIVTSPANLARLDAIRADNLRLADPRGTTPEEAARLAAEVPAIVLMAYGVHGDEISSGDAAILTAYHLLADRRPETRGLLDKVVVIIDPMQNPDGRDRFVQFHRGNRGVEPDAEPAAAERVQPWATGRVNHYLFDMNRDWFLQTQEETRARVAAYLRWQPHVTIDSHEMGTNAAHYYFDPPIEPILELITPKQRDWFARFARRHGARFDGFGFGYTTREHYDAFYPGYGSTWPVLHGSIGILWEQPSARGLVVDREDGTTLHYHDGVRHHYVSSLSTVETAAAHAKELVADFASYRASAVATGREGPVRDYLLLPGATPARAARLADLLVKNGIEVRRTTAPVKLKAKEGLDDAEKEWTAPAGSYHVPVAQPAARLVRSLLDPRFDMGEEVRKRQLDRKARRLGDEIYDVTAWSLPTVFYVRSLAVSGPSEIAGEPAPAPRSIGRVVGPDRAKVGYLVPAEDDAAMHLLARMLRLGLRAHVFDQPTRLGGVAYAKGTLLFRVADNPDRLHDEIRRAADEHGLAVHATDTGLVDEGAGLGGFDVTWVKPPKVAMIVDRPTSTAAGHTWYLFDQVWRHPLARIPAGSFSDLDLSRYNVLILPDGRYPGPLGEGAAQRIKDWVRAGGTLILVKGAAAWAAEKPVGLLASRVIKKPIPPPEAPAGPDKEKDKDKDQEKKEETPDAVPGAFFRASAYDDHFVTFGSPREVVPLVNTDLILAPLAANDGRNLVNFAARDRLLAGGFCWPTTLDLMAGKPLVLYQEAGKGHVVAFADDPNFRAMVPATQRFFLNAVFFGPGH
ncbi:M14 family zinc carboxypeptidase (plasmid) [Tundrisphaera sp. TA3]|uniref:M14 family zinc carboxypeptidase n=1 Tax=Tundrisphaera sp. TA3 TaxID=3435775 RepID=UPI003EB87280